MIVGAAVVIVLASDAVIVLRDVNNIVSRLYNEQNNVS